MTELENSARKLFRATYTPIKSSPKGGTGTVGSKPSTGNKALGSKSSTQAKAMTTRPRETRTIIGNLGIEDYELEKLKKDSTIQKFSETEVKQVFKTIEVIKRDNEMGIISDESFNIGYINTNLLAQICNKILQIREEDLGSFRKWYKQVYQRFQKEYDETRKLLLSDKFQKLGTNSKVSDKKRIDVDKKVRNVLVSVNMLSKDPYNDLKVLLAWSMEKPDLKDQSVEWLKRIEGISTSPVSKIDYENWTAGKTQTAYFATKAITELESIEPVGLLHLERINFIPSGIEKGELVYSVPLSPAEEVNITHKEWANTSEEFSKIVTDFLETYSEEGVSEKSDFSQSTNSQEQHSSGFNTGVTASGGYGPVSVSSTVGVSVSASASNSEQTAINHSLSITRKSSARSRKEHKMSFKLSSASGIEDQQVRKIRNPFSDRAVRVDYYQLVRKWKVDLYRYGIRLTYDLTIPEPGSDIIDKIKKIEELRDELENTGLQFDLQPQQVSMDPDDENYYQNLASRFGAQGIEPFDKPLGEPLILPINDNPVYGQEETSYPHYRDRSVEVPEEYYLDSIDIWGQSDGSAPSSRVFPSDEAIANGRYGVVGILNPTKEEMPPNGKLHGISGKVVFVYYSLEAERYDLTIEVTCKLRPEVYQKWQIDVWEKCRQAAESNLEKKRQMLQQQISRLTEELSGQDPLSLRKVEREEVMKGVLRWMFGPGFEFVPWLLPTSLYEPWSNQNYVIKTNLYNKMLSQGKLIQFLHHAIEWENMLYFLYPYFWSHPARWNLKKYLSHPDLMHRTFLKSGAARVVLTIRPGFEKEFVSFLNNNKYEPSASDAAYVSIAEEMQAYANTNYPGIRPANTPENARCLIHPKQRKTWEDMQKIFTLLNAYKDAKGIYPSTTQGLAVLQPFTTSSIPEVPTVDAWGNNFQYLSPGENGDGNYDLVSFGADGTAGGTGENADITSWAEASLIASWFDYTPTSALDIAFDEVMPNA